MADEITLQDLLQNEAALKDSLQYFNERAAKEWNEIQKGNGSKKLLNEYNKKIKLRDKWLDELRTKILKVHPERVERMSVNPKNKKKNSFIGTVSKMALSQLSKNPKRKNPPGVSAAKQFSEFHQRQPDKVTRLNINFNQPYVFIGNVPQLDYVSDKWDGKVRHYYHKLRKQGKLMISNDGKTAIITGLSLNIKKEGLTG